MTVKKLCEEMDAAELMEWVAYFETLDEEKYEKLELQIEQEKSQEEQTENLRNFLQRLK